MIRACADSADSAAWHEFITRFQKPIGLSIIRVARRWGASPQEFVDDLVQETYLKLCADKCRHLYQFSLAHPDTVEAYIKTIAMNLAHDFFKAHRSMKRGGGETVQLLDNLEPVAQHSSFGGPDAIQRDVLLGEIDHCLEECIDGPSKSRDKLIFLLHYRQGMSAHAIASLPTVDLNVKGVESALLRLRRIVRGQLVSLAEGRKRERRTEPKGLGPAKSY